MVINTKKFQEAYTKMGFDRMELVQLLEKETPADEVRMAVDRKLAQMFGAEKKGQWIFKHWTNPQTVYTIEQIAGILAANGIDEIIDAEQLIQETLRVDYDNEYGFEKIGCQDKTTKYRLEHAPTWVLSLTDQ